MKKVIISSLLCCSVIFAAESMSIEDKGCIENLENEIVKIVNSDIKKEDKQKAIESLKIKVKTDNHVTCESEFQEEIKKMVFGDKKVAPAKMIENHAKKSKQNSESADMNAQDCIENFEAEVLKIINSNPEDYNKEKTKQIMHEIMHDKVVESCESEFEKDTKTIVNSKSEN